MMLAALSMPSADDRMLLAARVTSSAPSRVMNSAMGYTSSFSRLSRHSADVAETDGHSGLEAIERHGSSHLLARGSFVPVDECHVAGLADSLA